MTPVHPEFASRGSFAHLPLGRSAKSPKPKLELARYIDDSALLPQIPDRCDWTLGVASWPMYGNDKLGDCTVAAAGHMEQAWAHGAGGDLTPDEQAVISAYWATGDGRDDGRMETDVLDYWRQQGVAGRKIEAYAFVDPGNLDHVRAAIFLFGGIYTGIALPLTAQTQTIWDVVGDGKSGNSEPGSWGGHAVPYEQYDPDGFACITWAHPLRLTVSFHNHYTDESYAVLSKDWLNAQGKSPDGFALNDLLSDLSAITSKQT